MWQNILLEVACLIFSPGFNMISSGTDFLYLFLLYCSLDKFAVVLSTGFLVFCCLGGFFPKFWFFSIYCVSFATYISPLVIQFNS